MFSLKSANIFADFFILLTHPLLAKTRTHSNGFTTTEYFCEPNSKSKSNNSSGTTEWLAATGVAVVAGAAGQMYFVVQSPVAGSNKVENGHVTTDPFIALELL